MWVDDIWIMLETVSIIFQWVASKETIKAVFVNCIWVGWFFLFYLNFWFWRIKMTYWIRIRIPFWSNWGLPPLVYVFLIISSLWCLFFLFVTLMSWWILMLVLIYVQAFRKNLIYVMLLRDRIFQCSRSLSTIGISFLHFSFPRY